ncbi:MAG: AMP-binding protein [Promethearchaeota archaeon]
MKWNKIPSINEPWLEYYPDVTPRNIDYPEFPLDLIVSEGANEFPDKPAIFFEGMMMTFRELDDAINKFAIGLKKLGIKKGDVVLIDLPNIPQFVISFYGVLRADAIANPVIPLNKYAEIRHQANDSSAKLVIILEILYEEHLKGKDLSELRTIDTIVLTGVGEYLSPLKRKIGNALNMIPRMKKWPTESGGKDVISFQEILDQDISKFNIQRNIDPMKDIACLIYTGGTTGTPKGVMLTHFNLIANCAQANVLVTTQIKDVEKLRGNGSMVCILPLSHAFGMSIAMNMGLWFKLALLLIVKPPLKISNILKLAAKHDAVFCPGVPTLWNRLNQDPSSKKHAMKLKNFKACLSGAAPLPLEVKEKFEKLTGAIITEGYGMSEASPLLTANPFIRSKPNSVGVPIPDTYIKIVDIETRKQILPKCPHVEPYCSESCGKDESQYIGEICASGPQIMAGYLNKPEETRHALRVDDDGITWYHTADIGCIDREGYLKIKDRLRDMIKYKGHSVFPREVEDLLYQFEPINEVGVYGVLSDDPEIGEMIKATISLKAEYKGKITKDDIITWCKKNISYYKYPREIEIVEELPKSLIGKVLRRVLRDRSQDQERDQAQSSNNEKST